MTSIRSIACFSVLCLGLSACALGRPPRDARLTQALKDVVDSGSVADPAMLGRILDIRFAPDKNRSWADFTVFKVEEADWYRPTSDGQPSDPSSSGSHRDKQTINYAVSVVQADAASQHEQRKAVLNLGGLNVYACLTRQRVAQLLPTSEDVWTGEGNRFRLYRANGTILQFEFAGGAACAVSAEIRTR